MEDEFLEDLLTAGHEVMERNPGLDFDNWLDTLMRQYPSEVIDAIGTNPVKVNASLKDLWERIRASQSVDFVSDDKSIIEAI